MGPYDRHLQRLQTDTAYKDGFDYGKVGGTTDANPWAIGDDRRSDWNHGWRVGSAFHSIAAGAEDAERELQRRMDAGELS